MNVGSLFSGVGGLDHGLANAGLRHVFLCEADEWRRGVLAARFPGVPIYDDVRGVQLAGGRLDAEAVQPTPERGRDGRDRIDLLCGGFPCQDLSVAGKRAGLMQEGGRSNLFFEFARIADALRPRWLLVENVPGLLSSNGGRDFGVVLGTLADLGYGVAWRVLDSRFFGVPQRRRRVFIVGTLADSDPVAAAGRAGAVLAVGSRCDRHFASGGEAGPSAADASVVSTLQSGGGDRGYRVDAEAAAGGHLVATALNLRGREEGARFEEDDLASLRAAEGGSSRSYVHVAAPLSHGSNPNSNMAGRRREDDVNLVAAFSENQRAEVLETPIARQLTSGGGKPGQGYSAVRDGASVRRLTPVECERLQALPDGWTQVPDSAPDSRRYAALGNAVTSSVAEWIGRRMLERTPA